MKKLILVRYGEYDNGHLSESGIQTMILAAEKMKSIVHDQNALIISAQIPRATESAEVISKHLNIHPVQNFIELYAAEEDGVCLNIDMAMNVINSVGKEHDIVIAVTSREYIETLPNYILKSLGSKQTIETHLSRGEIIILDYETKSVAFLRI